MAGGLWAVFIIQEDEFTPISAIHHMINRTFVFNA